MAIPGDPITMPFNGYEINNYIGDRIRIQFFENLGGAGFESVEFEFSEVGCGN